MNKYKAVIFDLDGTLLNTLDDLANAVNYALEYMGYERRTNEEICSFVGNGIRNLIKRAVPEDISSEEFEMCFNTFKSYYSENMYVCTAPYPGINSILKTLKEQGVKVGVVSNKADYAVSVLCEKFFDGLLDVSVGEISGKKLKPAPDTLFYALEKLGETAENAVYIGDSDVDILTANNAGMPCISVSWGFRTKEFLEEHNATVVADNAEELLKILI